MVGDRWMACVLSNMINIPSTPLLDGCTGRPEKMPNGRRIDRHTAGMRALKFDSQRAVGQWKRHLSRQNVVAVGRVIFEAAMSHHAHSSMPASLINKDSNDQATNNKHHCSCRSKGYGTRLFVSPLSL